MPEKNLKKYTADDPYKTPSFSPYIRRDDKRYSVSRKEETVMTHSLKICVSKKPMNGGLINVRNVTLREKVLRWLLGAPQKLTIIVPGNSIESVSIAEIVQGGTA